MDVQIRKGLLELCVLAVLREKDSYGYQIVKDVSAYIEMSESTLYPILRRLESDKKVESYNTEYNNRIRKYYRITDVGYDTIGEFKKEKVQLQTIINWISQ